MEPGDNTEIINMKKGFQKFVSGNDGSKRSRLDFSDSSILDSSLASLHKSYNQDCETLKIKSDLVYCKSRIGMLESQLHNKDTELQERAILHEREISELKRAHDRELRGYSVLKTSHERVLHRQEMCETELEDEKATVSHLKNVYDKKLLELHQLNIDQDIANTQLLEEQKAKCRELKNEKLTLQADLSVANSELSLLKEQLADLKKKLNDSLNNSMESEEWKSRATKAEEKLKEVQAELDRHQEDILVMSARKKDLARLNQISEENKSLNRQVMFYKATVDNVEVMKEKVRTLERQLVVHEQLQSQFAALQVENEVNRAKLVEVQSKQIPEDTLIRLHEAQKKEAVMLENIGELKSRNVLLESQVKDLENAATTLKSKLSGAGEDGQMKSKQMQKLQRNLILLTKERDGYKKILESYESEVTREVVPHANDKMNQLQQMVNNYSTAYAELEKQTQANEQEIANLKGTIEQLESAQASKSVEEPKPATLAKQLETEQLLQLRQKIEDLEKTCEKLSEDKEILEMRIEQRNMQGDYDPTKTKVLHFTRNPLSNAQMTKAEEVKILREEQIKLRERIRVLERNLSEAHDITAQVDKNLGSVSASESKQLKDLQEKLAAKEKNNERLMDMYKKTSLEFRQIVYQLTGFRIDVPRSKNYKLLNMYSNSPDDYLIFQESSEGELQLLENDYAVTVAEMAEEYLQGQGSIPIFLSNLTIELFKQTTMMASMS